MQQQTTNKYDSIWAVVLFAGALLIALFGLDRQSLWLDEGSTWAEVTGRTGKDLGTLLAELFSPDAAYPLYHVLLHGWLALAGDSEWALRLPSALAAASTVPLLWLAARQVCSPRVSWVAPLLAACSPFLLWHAQDAKVYALLIATLSLLLLTTLIALQRGGRWWWFVLALALISLFVHRLALFALAGILLGLALAQRQHRTYGWWVLLMLGGGLGALGVYGILQAVGSERQFASQVGVNPLASLWLTLTAFVTGNGQLGGWLGLPLWAWLLPLLLLTLLGSWRLVQASWHGDQAAGIVLGACLVPLTILAVALLFTPIYQGRYAAIAFPAWVLIVAAALRPNPPNLIRRAGFALLLLGMGVQLAALFQPQHGQFAGVAVKEQWREGVRAMAERLHPDDLVILHPYYVQPMWDYYAPRVTPDPLPAPVAFAGFSEGFVFESLSDPALIRNRFRREYEPVFNQAAFGKKRMLMLIAPDHARSIDPPKTLEELRDEANAAQPQPTSPDRYGWLGLRFQYDQNSWPCGGTGDALIGVEVMCQSFPETFNAAGNGTIPEPLIRREALFGNEIRLRGFTLNPAGEQFRPGGTLPITLYWAAAQRPTRNYTMFLHLCQDCRQPPVAQIDQPPLNGYPPAGYTTTWQIDDPLHDERSIPLPAELQPGRYTLVLGVYPADEPAIEQRLEVSSNAPILAGQRLVLGEIQIGE
jgi:hypothetical protein